MQPGDPVVGGTVLRRVAIRSPNFVHLVMGWSINQDGTAEFSGITITGGTFVLVDSSGNIVGSLDGDDGLVFIGNGTALNPGLTLSPFGDVVWGSGARIEAGSDQLSAIVGSSNEAAFTLAADLNIGGPGPAGMQVFPYLYGNDLSGSGTPVPPVEEWHNATILNGGSSPGGDLAQYRSMPDGDVQLQGQISGGTQTSGTTLFTLPGAYAPPKDLRIPAVAQNPGGSTFGVWTVHITTAGNVQVLVPPAGLTSLHLDGVRFSLLT